LFARAAELQALQQAPSSNASQSRSTSRPSYPPVDLWGPESASHPMLRSNIANHNSRGLIVPHHANLQDGLRSVSFLTKELKIDMETESSYATLTNMKEQVKRGYRDGNTDTDWDRYFDKPTKRTIEDTLARIYDQQNAALYYQGRSLPPRVPFDWVDLSDDKFFEKVPQLMRLEQSIQEDPITDCLALN